MKKAQQMQYKFKLNDFFINIKSVFYSNKFVFQLYKL